VRAALLACAFALPGIASAQDLEVRFDPAYAWASVSGTSVPSDGRVRLVPDTRGRVAALTENQFYDYQLAYRRALGRLSLRMPIDRARPRARDAAWQAIVGAGERVRLVDLAPLGTRTLPLPITPLE
jgi:hypothetical protein